MPTSPFSRGVFSYLDEPEPGGICSSELRMAQDILQAAAGNLLSMQ